MTFLKSVLFNYALCQFLPFNLLILRSTSSNVFHSCIVESHSPCFFFVPLYMYLFPIFFLSSPFPPIISENCLPFYETFFHNFPYVIFLQSISFFSFFLVLFLLTIPHFFSLLSYLSNLSLSPFFLSLFLFPSLLSFLHPPVHPALKDGKGKPLPFPSPSVFPPFPCLSKASRGSLRDVVYLG